MVAVETRRPDPVVVMFVSAVTISGKHSILEVLIIKKKKCYKIIYHKN